MCGIWVRVAKVVGKADGRERVIVAVGCGVELDHRGGRLTV